MSASFTAFSQIKFHYLILGGGTAGLAVAARLSEDPEVQVGVIEAGPSAFEEPAITVPGRYGEAIGSAYDWEFETTPQPGLGGRSLPWPRGRVLGGTSALNLMAWNRGHKEDYDAWARLGNEGWGWSDLLLVGTCSDWLASPDLLKLTVLQAILSTKRNLQPTECLPPGTVQVCVSKMLQW